MVLTNHNHILSMQKSPALFCSFELRVTVKLPRNRQNTHKSMADFASNVLDLLLFYNTTLYDLCVQVSLLELKVNADLAA